MKVPASIRRIYDDQKEYNDRLKVVVDESMRSLKWSQWHYESRVKALQSFALKIESGRFSKPEALEDFFACTLVVSNMREVSDAEHMVGSHYVIKARRPPSRDRTYKSPDEFSFDDLRLNVTLPDDRARPPTDLHGIIFEVQIKTYLQHAWAIATHDLIYKSDDVNWSKERISYQVKAMLEHAEVSIQEAEALSECSALAMENTKTTSTKKAIALVKRQWNADELPGDVRRLAQNIITVTEALGYDSERLENMLNEGKAMRQGNHPTNMSPYATVIQYLMWTDKQNIIKLLMKEKSRIKILIPSEVELPDGCDPELFMNAVFVK